MATQPARVIILLAHGFREGPVVTCLENMRAASLAVSVVGLTAGLIMGKHGLALQPDYSLSEWQQQTRTDPPPSLLILPGGRGSATALSSDPRVHRLLTATEREGGYVATLAAEPYLLETLTKRLHQKAALSHFIQRGHQSPQSFIQQLIELVEPEPKQSERQSPQAERSPAQA